MTTWETVKASGKTGNVSGRNFGEQEGAKTSWITGGKQSSTVRMAPHTHGSVLNSLLETIWVDFVLKNPLQVDVELTDLTIVVKEVGETQQDQPQEELVEVEEIDNISLAPGEQRTVSLPLGSVFFAVVSLTHRTQDPDLHQIPTTSEACAHRTHLQILCFGPLLRSPWYARATTKRHPRPKAKQDLRS